MSASGSRRLSRPAQVLLLITLLNALVTGWLAAHHLEPFADLATYYQEAQNLAQGKGFSLDIKIVVNSPFTRAPFPVGDRFLYPLITALSLRLFGDSLAVANVVSALAMALTAIPLYWLGKLLFSARAGLVAAGLFALNPFYHIIGIGAWTDLSAALCYSTTLALLAGYLRAPPDGGRAPALWSGLGFALAVLAREDAVVLGVGLAGAWWLKGRRGADALAFLAFPLAAFAARSLYLWQTFGSPLYGERSYFFLPRWPLWYYLGTFTPQEYLDYVGGVGGALQIRLYNYARFTQNLFSDGFFYYTETGLMPSLLLAAVGAALWRSRAPVLLMAAVAALQFLLGIGFPGYAGNSTEVRHGQLIAPFLLLLAGAGLVRLHAHAGIRRALALTLGGVYCLFAVTYLGQWGLTLTRPPYRGPIVRAAQWAGLHLPADAVLMTRRAAETHYFSGRTVIATPSAPFADLLAFAQAHRVTHLVLSSDDRSGAPNLVQAIRAFPQNFSAVYATETLRIIAIKDYQVPGSLPPDADLYAGKTTGRPERLFDWRDLSVSGSGIIHEHFAEGWGGLVAAAQSPRLPGSERAASPNLRAGDAIVLDAYRVAPADVRPGDELQVTLNWGARAATPANYVVFVHLLDAGGALRAQHDAPPLHGERPTFLWAPGESIEEQITLWVPGDAPPGDYRIALGLYDSGTGARLPMTDAGGARLADDRLLISGVSVRP